MEVHHHAHTSRKKWTHYFWEFLMLFLAVFAGFMAENQREHYIEHQRAKQLAKNLYEEIHADSIIIANVINNRTMKEKACSYFINYVIDSNLTTLSRQFYPAFTTALIQTQYIIFEPNDGILTQLRNSGELRYFRNSELQSEISKLSVKISHLRTRNDREYSYVEFYLRPFLIKHFDFSWYKAITHDGSVLLSESLRRNQDMTYASKIVNMDIFKVQEAQNIASYYLLMLRSSRQIQYKEYTESNHRVLELLRKEFKLK